MGWRRYLERGRRDEDLAREIESYLTHETDDNRARGMTEDDARRAARRKLGNPAQVRETVFEANSLRLVECAWRDLTQAARQLWLNPIFALTAILSVALGIGANTAIFTLLHASLWKPLRVENPQQIVHLVRGKPGDNEGEFSYSYVLFQQLGEAARPAGDLVAKAAFGLRKFSADGDSSERVVGEAVSANFFSTLRVKPALGRVLHEPDDNVSGGDRVAVLSHAFWTRRFQSSPAILGKTIYYKERPYTVVGVVQRGFTGVEAETSVDVWVPITADAERAWLTSPHNNWLRLLVRLHPDANSAEVQGALDGVFRSHVEREVLPGVPPHFTPILAAQHLRLRPASAGLSTLGRRYEKPLQLLMAVVALVLLISCANVANLVMARNASRQHEIALRLALGATRGRIVSQLFSESLVLALSGATAGVALAIWANRVLLSLVPETPVPLAYDLGPDATVLAFTTAVAVATALVFGLAPALGAYQTSRNRAVSSGRRITSHSLTGRCLVAGQLALSLLLLIGAGLFLETIGNLKAIDLGFRPQNLVSFEVSFPRGTPPERVRHAYQQIHERLASRPGVIAVSYSTPALYEGGGWSSPVETEDRRAAPGEDNEVALMAVGPGFVQTVGLELRQGRDLSAHDHGGPPVAVVNETFATRYFGRTPAIGRRIRLPGYQPELREIVGVVGDARHFGARGRVWPQVYLPDAMEGSVLVVRSAAAARLAVPSIREAVLAVNSTAQIERVQQLEAIVDSSFSQERLTAALCTSFAVLAAVLAAIGLYGVMAYSVARRTSELGIRMALGARRGHVLWLVLRETLQMLSIGGAAGLIGALASTRFLSSLLYGVKPTDAFVFMAATLLLIAVALVAALLPARRASRIDPMIALRCE